MTPELWNRLKPFFEAAVEKAAADREAFIATLDAEDDLRHELRELLKAYEGGQTTLDGIAANLRALVPSATPGLRPGEILLQRFRIVRWLGSGGMGDVYEAFDLELGESVALKTIRPPIAGDPDVLARLKREVQIARHLTSPNLCRIHELFVGKGDQPCVFFTMELLEGVTLAEEIGKRGPLAWPEARQIANEICVALESMHAAGILHRDAKTRNIMLVTRNGSMHPILMDFGLARELAPPQADSQTASTLPGVFVGTPACMAPEQFSGGALSPATDIYAMGVVLYEMLTGVPPYPANDPIRAAIQRAKPPVPVSQLRPQLPHGIDHITDKCLAYEPTNRYQSSLELARDLESVSALPRALAPREWPTGIKWALGVLLLAGVGMGAWRFAGRRPPAPDPSAVRWYEAGLAALREGSYMQAARAFEQSVKLDNRFAAAHARLAEAWAELDYTGAAEHEVLIALQQKQPKVLSPLDRKYVEAVQASLAHDFDGALRRQQEILEALPNDQKSFGYVDLGRAQEKSGDTSAAIKSYQTAANLSSDNPAALVHLGILTSRQQDSSVAEAAFAAAEDLYRLKQNIEGLAEVYFQRAHWANERGNPPQAELWLEKCMELARQIRSVQLEVRVLTQLSNVEYQSNRDAKSIEDAQRAIQLARENKLDYWVGDGLIRQANALLDKRDFAQAETVTQQALKIAEQHQFGRLAANAHFTLASIRDQQGRRNEQIQHARAALSLYEKSAFRSEAIATEDLLVRAQLALGNIVEALHSATKLLQDSEKLGTPAAIEDAEVTFGNVLMKMSRYPEALEHYQKALRLSEVTKLPAEYELLHCADALLNIGNYGESEKILQKIASQRAVSPDIAAGVALARAQMRLSQRRFDEAADMSTRAMRQFTDLASDEQMDFGLVAAVAFLETGRKSEAAQEGQKLARLAQRENNPLFRAMTNYLLALVDMRTGSPARARQEAESALTYFSSQRKPEREWMSFVCLAQVGMALRDHNMAAQNARRALDTLQAMQQSWDDETRQFYRGRPDTRFAVTQMNLVLARQ